VRTSLEIRAAASADDVDAARLLVHQYAAEIGVNLDFQGFAEELRGFPSAYAPPCGALLVARECGAHVGVIGVRPLEPPEEAELKRLYVRPMCRRRGTGTALIRRALEVAAGLGYLRVRLDSLLSMQSALSLYRQLGFVECEPYVDSPLPSRFFVKFLH
jgi:putative acetyltransferase